MDANSILSRSANVTYEVVGDSAILIRMDTGTYFDINRIGTEFWQMLDGLQTIQQHAATIALKYEVDVSMVITDLLEIAGEMGHEKLIVISSQR